MDFRYLLYFERDARVDVLERLAGMAMPTDDAATTLVLPDRTVELPFGTWWMPQHRLAWDDTSEPWDFRTVLCFPPDEPLEDYLHRLDGTPAPSDASRYDERGRLRIGFIYLEVRDEPSGTGEDLVRFAFGTPGTTMSILFMESESIRSSFVELLEDCRGVYGVFDMEDYGDLIWLRGAARDDRLPNSELSLAEIEELVAAGQEEPVAPEEPTAPPSPLPFSFAAEQVITAAKHYRRTGKGTELGVNHWLVALHEDDDSREAVDCRQSLAYGGIGRQLSEEQVRDRATRHAREAGRTLVSAQDVEAAVREPGRAS